MAPAKSFTRDEVSKQNSEDSTWLIIDSTVYDVTDFLDAHPGGEAVLRQVAGQDATSQFYNLHRHEVLVKYASLVIGTIQGEKAQIETPHPGDLSKVPYAEPLWLTPPFRTPYYNDSHRRLQKAMRIFTDNYITPEAQECETTGRYISQELIDRMAKAGILHMRLGPGKHLHGVDLLDGTVNGEEFDYFHDLIIGQEIVRANARGFQDGNMADMVIGLTAVLNFARDPMFRDRIANEVFSGEKKICLAISEAFAGSDVANLRTTALKTPDGKHYVRKAEPSA
jgi:predicted heme/steroid binding protein